MIQGFTANRAVPINAGRMPISQRSPRFTSQIASEFSISVTLYAPIGTGSSMVVGRKK
jgi:hypothetical protein